MGHDMLKYYNRLDIHYHGTPMESISDKSIIIDSDDKSLCNTKSFFILESIETISSFTEFITVLISTGRWEDNMLFQCKERRK